MKTIAKTNIMNLSVSEHLQLVDDIWDTIAETPEQLSLSEEKIAELDQRLSSYYEAPNEGTPWKELKQRIELRAKPITDN